VTSAATMPMPLPRGARSRRIALKAVPAVVTAPTVTAPRLARVGAGLRRSLPGLDLTAAVSATAATLLARRPTTGVPAADVWTAIVIALAWPAAVAGCHGYRGRVRTSFFDRSVLSAAVHVVALIAVLVTVGALRPSAGTAPTLVVASLLAVIGVRPLVRLIALATGRRAAVRRVVVVAADGSVEAVAHRAAGVLARSAGRMPVTVTTAPVSATSNPAAVAAAVAEYLPDAVVVDSASLSPSQLRMLLPRLESSAADVLVLPGLDGVDAARIDAETVDGVAVLHLSAPSRGLPRLAKDVVDRTIAGLVLLMLSPLLAVLALLVRFTSSGPALFVQTRVGRDGREFRMWKFRSMYTDAESRRAELDACNEGAGPLFKIRCDPRVTPLGRVLRRFSLDELPQLWNVVTGSMSLVGPRPPLPSEVACYDAEVRRRLRVKPGLTGLWQISGRSDLTWAEAVRLDLYYVDNWSLRSDVSIVARTVRAVLSSSGAY